MVIVDIQLIALQGGRKPGPLFSAGLCEGTPILCLLSKVPFGILDFAWSPSRGTLSADAVGEGCNPTLFVNRLCIRLDQVVGMRLSLSFVN